MYTDFFGLKEKPFNLTPSPRFLYLGESHKEALALLTYGVNERKGFILLTGEVGTGKTTMVQALLENLGEGVEYVYLSNPLLSPDDLMNYLAFSALKKRVHFKSKSEFILEFEVFLKQCLQHHKNFVLIIDEAQKLSFELLEEIRLLSNMETADEKLINIFLVGQPELNEKLSEQRCRPLLQRISIRHHISPLNLEEINEYVKTRLSVAGARNGRNIFLGSAIKALHEYSSGYPRMINILADNALLLGYARGKKKISSDMIKECYRDMKLEGSFLRPKQEAPEPPVIVRPNKTRFLSPWLWVSGLILILLVFGLGMSPQGRDFLSPYIPWLSIKADIPIAGVEPAHTPTQESVVNSNASATEDKSPQVDDTPPVVIDAREEVSPPAVQNEGPEKVGISPEPLPEKEPWQTIIVKPGDTVIELAAKVYGFADDHILAMVQENNPSIVNLDRIEVGQKIVFPTITGSSDRNPTYTVHIASFRPFEKARELFQKLMQEGYEVYIMPVFNPEKGKVFRITLGSFKSRREGNAYAAAILRREISDYAETIQLEMR